MFNFLLGATMGYSFQEMVSLSADKITEDPDLPIKRAISQAGFSPFEDGLEAAVRKEVGKRTEKRVRIREKIRKADLRHTPHPIGDRD